MQKPLFDAVLENVNPAIDFALEQTLGRPWLEEWALVVIDALESTLNEYGGQVAPGFECYLGVQTTDVSAEKLSNASRRSCTKNCLPCACAVSATPYRRPMWRLLLCGSQRPRPCFKKSHTQPASQTA